MMKIIRLLIVMIVGSILWCAQIHAARAGGAELSQTACSDDAELNQFWQLIGDNLTEYQLQANAGGVRVD